jgi:hypothetical protein
MDHDPQVTIVQMMMRTTTAIHKPDSPLQFQEPIPEVDSTSDFLSTDSSVL